MPSSGTQSIALIATRSDHEQVIRAVESKRELKYLAYGMRESVARDVYDSGVDIPELGIAKRGISVVEAIYLIMPKQIRTVITPVPQNNGGILYKVDPRDHPGCLMYFPGGVFEGNTLIAGEINTAQVDREAVGAMRDFRREIKKRFTRVREYWFGPEAFSLFEGGMRATQDIRSVPELDIR